MLRMLREKREALKKNNKGFTLMELLVVVAILGFLVAMLAPKYMNYTDKAMGVAAASDAKSVLNIAAARMMDTNKLPSIAEIDAALNTKFASGGAGADKSLSLVETSGVYTYTYTKNGVKITAEIDLFSSTTGFDIIEANGNSASEAKLFRVARGIGSGSSVKVKGSDFTGFNE